MRYHLTVIFHIDSNNYEKYKSNNMKRNGNYFKMRVKDISKQPAP